MLKLLKVTKLKRRNERKMSKKPPKIEVIGTPRWRGSTLHVRARLNYAKTSIVLGFNIPSSKLQNEGDLEAELKSLYEQNRPQTRQVNVPKEIDW